jgi:hypothetical protein
MTTIIPTIKFSIKSPKNTTSPKNLDSRRKLFTLSFNEHILDEAKCVIDIGCEQLVYMCVEYNKDDSKDKKDRSGFIKVHINRIDDALCVIVEDAINSRDDFKTLQADILQLRITAFAKMVMPVLNRKTNISMGRQAISSAKVHLAEIKKMSF